jgi:hypothetical protein
VNVNYLGMLAPDLTIPNGTQNPADIMNVIRTRLMRHRRKLSFKVNGVEMIPQPQNGNKGTVDADNGPKPQYCTPLMLTDTTFMVQYQIIARYWESSGGAAGAVSSINPAGNPIVQNLPGNNVLYNRWTETVEMDACQYSTRSRQGKFVIRSDNTDGYTADQLRSQMAVIGVPSGYLRESSSYTIDPNGLGLSYKITDKEQYQMPPYPAFVAEGTYTETAKVYGACRFATVQIHLEGDNSDGSQQQLIGAAVSTCTAKLLQRSQQLNRNANPKGFNFMMTDAMLRIGMYKNTVDMSIGARIIVTTARTKGKDDPKQNAVIQGAISAFVGMSTITPNSEADYTPAYKDYGTSTPYPRLLQAAAYYDPSLVNVFMSQTKQQMSDGLQPGQAGKTLES